MQVNNKDAELNNLHQRIFELEKSLDEFEKLKKSSKQKEEELRETTDKYRTIFENSGIPIIFIEEDSTISLVNRKFEKITGFSKEDVEGKKSFLEFVAYPEEKQMVREYHHLRRIDPDAAPSSYQLHFLAKGGQIREAIATVSMVPGTKESLAAFTDITEQKKVEHALKASIERFNQVVENAEEWVWELDPTGLYAYSNPNVEKILGYRPEEIVGIKHFYDFYKPEEREDKKKAAFKVLDKRQPFKSLENIKLHKNGREVILETSGVPFFDENNNFRGYRGVENDITKRKESERLLLESQNKLKIAMDLANLVHWEYDVKADLFYFDDQFYSLYGTTTDQMGGAKMSSEEYARRFIPPEEADKVGLEIAKALKTDDPDYRGYAEHSIIRADGEKRYIVVKYGVVKDEKGETIRTYGANQDITERVMAERNIKVLSELLNLANEAIIIHDIQGKILFWNEGAAKMYGWTREEAIGKICHKLLQTQFNGYLNEIYGHIMDDGYWKGELVQTTRDGSQLIVDSRWTLKTDENDKAVSILEINTNITERVKAEEDLRRSEKKYHSLYSNISEGMAILELVYNPQGKAVDYVITDVNPAYERIIGLNRDEVIGKRASELHGSLTKNIDKYEAVAQQGVPCRFESYYPDIDRYFSVSVTSPGKGKVALLFEDITERKKSEEEMKASLRRTELLLQEVHHRVKNNLQIISSLLDLQATYVEDEEAINVLRESENRVLSMAMIHEMLYDSEDLSTINFQDYIQNLVYDLFNSYGVKNLLLDLNLNVEGKRLNIETAVPCGLIINELVSNSLKYAFPGDRRGVLTIDFHRQQDDEYQLVIADDGVGLPPDFDLEKTYSLGLRLVTSLVKQLEGTMELDRSQGTKYIIQFRELEYRKRI